MIRLSRLLNCTAMGLSILASTATHAGLIETFEASGVTRCSVSNTQVVDFNDMSLGYTSSATVQLSSLTITYSGDVFTVAADQYGGAPDLSDPTKDMNYLGVGSGQSVTMTLSTPQPYFGIWFSAADQFNNIDFYHGNTLLSSVAGTGPVLSSLSSSYNGNP